jgi:hypothetical protein
MFVVAISNVHRGLSDLSMFEYLQRLYWDPLTIFPCPDYLFVQWDLCLPLPFLATEGKTIKDMDIR